MKKYLIILILIICSINTAKATNWKQITDNIYYDTDTIEYIDSGIRFWLKNIISNGSIKELVFLNLDEKKITLEQTYIYNKEEILISSSKSSVSERIIPDTVSEILYQYFSNNRNSFDFKKTNNIEATKQPDFGPYMRDLQRRIKANWDPPKGYESKKVVLLFSIAKDGRLLDVRVSKSSGLQAADRAAISAVELSAPFKPLPSEYKRSSVDIQFTFDYNIFGVSGY